MCVRLCRDVEPLLAKVGDVVSERSLNAERAGCDMHTLAGSDFFIAARSIEIDGPLHMQVARGGWVYRFGRFMWRVPVN